MKTQKTKKKFNLLEVKRALYLKENSIIKSIRNAVLVPEIRLSNSGSYPETNQHLITPSCLNVSVVETIRGL